LVKKGTKRGGGKGKGLRREKCANLKLDYVLNDFGNGAGQNVKKNQRCWERDRVCSVVRSPSSVCETLPSKRRNETLWTVERN